MFYPGIAPWTPANLSDKKRLTFWAKGDGRSYLVMLFAGSLGSMPSSVPFIANAEWQRFSFALSQFNQADGHDLLGILFTASPAPGKFAFQIDEVHFE